MTKDENNKISASIASLVTYFFTTDLIFLATTITMLSIMLADVGNIRRHRALVDGNSNEIDTWRYQYKFLSTSFMLTMGVWCFFCFILSTDPFLHLLCVATTMGNILNLICRNFSDGRTLTLQLSAVSKRLSLLFKNVEAQSEEKEAFGIQLNEALERFVVR